MDTRRFRERRAQALSQFQFWGWVLMMMFVVVQAG